MDEYRKDGDRKEVFNEEYYRNYCGGVPYTRNEPHWGRFFGNVANKIIETISPRSVLDLGCAKGFLVEAFRDRGVDANGVDISVYAIGQVREDIRQFCRIGSITEPLDRDYDLITCIEVLEHVPEEEAKIAIHNMTKRTQNILFSSPPDDFDEPTHINVHPIDYWLELFYENGFYPDVTVDASFLVPWAIVLRKKAPIQDNDLLYFYAHHIATKMECFVKRNELGEKNQQMEEEIRQLRATVRFQRHDLIKIQSNLGWRLGKELEGLINRTLPVFSVRRKYYEFTLLLVRTLVRKIRQRLTRESIGFWDAFHEKLFERRLDALELNSSDDPSYNVWISQQEPRKTHLKAMRFEAKSWSYQPKISLITPVYNPDEYELTECLQSVLVQIYDHWELCLVDGGSDKGYVRKVIKKFAKMDRRIKVISLSKNQGIAGNSNEALKLATGEYVGFLDHDDMLAPFTLYEVVRSLNQDRTIDFIYSDEDKVPAQGTNRYDPFFKPEWSPDTFLSYNYLCHFSVVRRAIAEKIGWFREGYDGAQDYDLLLRITEQTTKIKRIPKILYHWRATPGSVASELMAKPDALDSAKRSIGAYLKSRGLEAEVLDGIFPTSYRVKYKLRSSQHVSIIIPTRDQVHLLRQCVSSILEKTAYQDYEILIVDNQSKEPETHEFFHSMSGHERVRVIQYDKPFNYAAINNHAVRSARSPYILFLNNDTEVISQEWLSAMLECAQRDDVGAVGAKLLYPNDTIQHAGVMIGIGGIANHPHRGYPRVSHGYMGALSVIHNVSAVTGACMMVRKEVFNEVGGLNESLSHAYNDVDLCLKMREKGYLIIYTPYAELYHHESASRGYEDTPGRKARFLEEKDILYARWKHVFNAGDPYYSPNLTVEREDVSIKISTG